MALLSNFGSEEGRDPEGMAHLFGPGHVDQMIRQAIQICWMCLPKERRNADEVEREVRRIVDRALANYREDNDAFGRNADG